MQIQVKNDDFLKKFFTKKKLLILLFKIFFILIKFFFKTYKVIVHNVYQIQQNDNEALIQPQV